MEQLTVKDENITKVVIELMKYDWSGVSKYGIRDIVESFTAKFKRAYEQDNPEVKQ